MSALGDTDTRRLAGRILLAQTVVTLGLAALVAVAVDGASGRSAFIGGSIGLIANLFMTLAALRYTHSPGLALGRILIGQLGKVLLTVGMFLALAQRKDVVWPAALAGYAATLLVFWAAPVLSSPRLPPRSKERR
jgi:F0F1-type ATP synthase assembly protein I